MKKYSDSTFIHIHPSPSQHSFISEKKHKKSFRS